MMARLAFAAAAMDGDLRGADADFSGVSIDTRTLQPGNLFIALEGPNFDGADYLDKAAAAGAVGAVVNRHVDCDLPQIVVADSRLALGQLGATWRDRQDVLLVAITGSNGKTTLKEMTRAILERVGPTLATAGNLNNDIGMPLMLTRLDVTHRYAVIEMGANHAGEIGYLVSLAKPQVVALANAGPAHLEGFGSIEGVARAKGEILTGLPRPRTAILNADDKFFGYWQELASDIRVLSFGTGEAADIRARNIELFASGSRFDLHMPDRDPVSVSLSLSGEHNVRNACAAAAICAALGVETRTIADGLADVLPVGGRLAEIAGSNGTTLIDDSYNANPTSVAAAAGILGAAEGRTIFVLGDMGELGADAEAMHREAGGAIRDAGVDCLLATGPLSRAAVEGFGEGGEWFDGVGELIERATDLLAPGTTVLVKGSRSAGMERVVMALTRMPAVAEGAC